MHPPVSPDQLCEGVRPTVLHRRGQTYHAYEVLSGSTWHFRRSGQPSLHGSRPARSRGAGWRFWWTTRSMKGVMACQRRSRSWKWFAPGWTVRFLPGGIADSFSPNDKNTGTWRLVSTSPRVYEIRWVKGATIDT